MNASDPGERSTRVEREILEILERADNAQTPVDNFQDAVRRKRAAARAHIADRPHPRWSVRGLSPELLRIGGALLLAVAAVTIEDFSRLLAVVLAIASAAVFFSLWVPSRPTGLGDQPRWRGQRLDDDGPRFTFGGSRTPPWRGPRRPSR